MQQPVPKAWCNMASATLHATASQPCARQDKNFYNTDLPQIITITVLNSDNYCMTSAKLQLYVT